MNEASVDTQRIEQLAILWEKYQERRALLDQEGDALRAEIVPLVERHGTHPPRADKTKALYGAGGAELRVTTSQEVSIDVSCVQDFRARLRELKLTRKFRKLFKPVQRFVLADGAFEYACAHLSVTLRSRFLAAIRNDARAATIEVRRKEKKAEAA